MKVAERAREEWTLTIEVEYDADASPGYPATWEEPGEGPSVEVEVRAVWYRRPSKERVLLELPAVVVEDIARELEDEMAVTLGEGG
jgi:hypothetical protein